MSAPRLREALRTAINSVSAENGSNTPDFILAEYLDRCLEAFDAALNERERWYDCHHAPGGVRGPLQEGPSLEPAPGPDPESEAKP